MTWFYQAYSVDWDIQKDQHLLRVQLENRSYFNLEKFCRASWWKDARSIRVPTFQFWCSPLCCIYESHFILLISEHILFLFTHISLDRLFQTYLFLDDLKPLVHSKIQTHLATWFSFQYIASSFQSWLFVKTHLLRAQGL